MKPSREAIRPVLVAGAIFIVLGSLALAGDGPSNARAAAIDKLLEEIGQGKNPGIALAVVEPGKPPFVRCKGLAEIEKNAPISATTLFYVASMAKQFTAACVLLAERDGKLARADLASKYFPALKSSSATIADLLDHRSGIPDLYEVLAIAGSEDDPLASNAAGLAIAEKLAPTSELPGRRFSYSNTAYLVLTEIVHKATGIDFPEYARTRIFTPLGMTRSIFRDRRDLSIDDRAYGYETESGRALRQDEDEEVGFCGPGGLFTSIEDLMRWDESIRTGKPLGRDFIAQQTTPRGIPDGFRSDPRFAAYAAGLIIDDFRGHRVVRHAGGTGAFSSEMLRFDDPAVSVICLSNDGSVGATGIAESVAEIWLGAKAAASDVPAAAKGVPVPRGFYANPDRSEVWFLGERGGSLVLSTIGVTNPVRVGADDRLIGSNARSPFVAKADVASKEKAELHVTLGKQTVDVAFVAAGPSPVAAGCDVAGVYRHVALQTLVDLAVDHGRLMLVPKSGDAKPIPLLQLDRDCYVNDRLVITVERDAAGKPIGFTASTDRARGQKFVRINP